jgi:hypothetical protein
MGCCCSNKSSLDQHLLDESTTIDPDKTSTTTRPSDVLVKESTKNLLSDVSKKRPLVRIRKAVKIQGAWRRYRCRRNFLKARAGIILIQADIRRVLARKTAVLALKEDLLHNIVVSLECASDVQVEGSIGIYAVVTGYNHERHRKHFQHRQNIASGDARSSIDEHEEKKSSGADSAIKTVGPDSRRMNLVSYNKSSQVSKGNKFHYWGEKILVTGLRFDGDIVISLFEHHKITTDRLIGQVLIYL